MAMDEQNLIATLKELLLVVVRRWKLIVAIYAGILATAIVGIFVIPPEYRASARILLTTDRAQVSTSSDRPTEIMRTSSVSDSEIASQTEVLRSRELVEQVLESMEPPPDPTAVPETESMLLHVLRTPYRALRNAYRSMHHLDEVEPNSPHYFEAMNVLEGLGTGRVGQSNLIEVGLASTDPGWAKEFVDRLTHAYVERHAQMQQVQEAEDFFVKQSQLLQKKLLDSENALRGAREKAGALQGQQSEIHERLNEFSGELSRTNISRAELEQRVVYLESLQANASKRGRIATPQLLELEAKRAELLGRYRPESEKVRDIDQQIARLRSAIAGYDTITTSNAGGASGATDLVSARASLAALKGKEDALAEQRDIYRKQAEMLDAQSFDVARLERQTKVDEEAYLSYVRTAEQSRLSSALEQSKIMRLTIVEPATVPMDPFSPKKGRILFFAMFGGLAVAIGAAFARDQFDATLKSAAEVRRYGRMEVLAAIPDRS